MTPEQEKVVKQMEWAQDDLRVRWAIRLLEEIKPAGKAELGLLQDARHKLGQLLRVMDERS
jgi:hypothetical protein